MTEIVVARRDGTLKGPDGVRYRLLRGKTLAHADHPAVIENPDAFTPMTITLRSEGGVSDSEQDGPGIEDLREQLAEVEETAERYRLQLVEISNALNERGLIGADTDTGVEGWLTTAILAAVDGSAEPEKPKAPRRRLATAGGDGNKS